MAGEAEAGATRHVVPAWRINLQLRFERGPRQPTARGYLAGRQAEAKAEAIRGHVHHANSYVICG